MSEIPNTLPELLAAFRTQSPTSPRLTWYGDGGERVELSGRVLENWVAKTANYLVDELDAEPGTVVAVDLPAHWRSLVWALAIWATGGQAVLGTPADADAVDILVTADPSTVTGTPELVVAVALPALAMRYPGVLPPRVLDYSGGVRAHADVFFADDAPQDEDLAWVTATTRIDYATLLATPAATPQRLLVEATTGWDAVVPAVVRTWAGGGSIVLLGHGVPASDHLRTVEHTTAG